MKVTITETKTIVIEGTPEEVAQAIQPHEEPEELTFTSRYPALTARIQQRQAELARERAKR